MLLEKGNTMLIIAQRSEIIRRLEISKSFIKLGALTMYDIKKQKYQLQFLWCKLKT